MGSIFTWSTYWCFWCLPVSWDTWKFTRQQTLKARWWFKYVLFSPLLGEMIQFDDHIFQLGWFNHQEVRFSLSTSFFCWISSTGVFFCWTAKTWRTSPEFRDVAQRISWTSGQASTLGLVGFFGLYGDLGNRQKFRERQDPCLSSFPSLRGFFGGFGGLKSWGKATTYYSRWMKFWWMG